jgi:predicted nucleic acid-binding protein
LLLAVCRTGRHEFVNTGALEYEAIRNPDPVRRAHASGILQEARVRIWLSEAVEIAAMANEGIGFRPLDALHLAYAVEGEVDYLCTCDDRFLRMVNGLNLGRPKVVSPVDLLTEIGP